MARSKPMPPPKSSPGVMTPGGMIVKAPGGKTPSIRKG